MTVVKFENVSVTYPNGFCAARGASFAIAASETLAIVGESGSGKTTLARAALGLLPAKSIITGSIKINDTEIIGASAQTLRELRGLTVGFVAQEPFSAFNPLARVFDHVAEAWRVHGLRPPAEKIVAALENSGVLGAKKSLRQFPHEWSGGMLQRATIAAAVAHQPKLIIADEPTSALDANRADAILRLLQATGAAILLVSHDINLVARYANRIAVCERGEIVEIGGATEIFGKPQAAYTKSFLKSFATEKRQLAPTDSELILQARNLSRIYQDFYAVREANLEIRPGEIVGIGGESGSGKSTLLRLLATIEQPSSGAVFLGGELATSGDSPKILSKKARGGFIAPIFQNPLSSLDARWAIWRSATEPLTAKHRKTSLATRQRKEIAREVLAKVGLPDVDLEARPRELSVGQCQRVCVARALIAEPQIIVADEPFSALDASLTREILQLFRLIAENKGIAVVIVSHDEKSLAAICHRVLTMRDGVLENERL